MFLLPIVKWQISKKLDVQRKISCRFEMSAFDNARNKKFYLFNKKVIFVISEVSTVKATTLFTKKFQVLTIFLFIQICQIKL